MTDTDVLIVGGGPVGLYLGCCLASCGIAFQIVERRSQPSMHTKSIGIHPPALELLSQVGVAEALIDTGVQVSSAEAVGGTAVLGRLSFASCPGPYRFVLAIPQRRTESLLRQRLEELAPGSLKPDATVDAVREAPDFVCTTLRNGDSIRSRVVVGCDGMESQVRRSVGFGFHGAEYPDRYAMGDFADTSGLGATACVFLGRSGLVESFPLPGNVRRWVARETVASGIPDEAQLAQVVQRRTGHVVAASSATMFSAFRTYSFLAQPFARGRVFLAGDAGHVVSPIGGQGMNLGWMDVADLVPALRLRLAGQVEPDRVAQEYAARRSRAYRIAKRRAEFNMWMGRQGRASLAKQWATRLVLKSPVAAYFAARFSMRGLPAAS
jgi:2-polyprenyl-6-methoxyphenol hydroxylase-like FAD-dependent oxidoreductase